MAKNKEHVSSGAGDMRQLELLRDILFGPQIQGLQEQIDSLSSDLDAARKENVALRSDYEKQAKSDNQKLSAIERNLTETTQKMMQMHREEAKQEIDLLTQTINQYTQKGSDQNRLLVETLSTLYEGNNIGLAEVIKQLQTIRKQQTKQVAKLRQIIQADQENNE